MSKFVLVHGSFHGAWCWERVVPSLLHAGHEVHGGREEHASPKVLAGDLPGHGEDQTPLSAITLQSYVDRVLGWMEEANGQVVLVGHSFGGVVISQVAEQAPEKVKALVYISAVVPGNGQNAFQMVGQNDELAANLILNEAEGWGFVKQEAIPAIYYNDCSPEDVQFALSHLRVEPLAPYFQPLQLTAERFGQVPKYYIGCQQDHAVPAAIQQQICEQTHMLEIIPLNTSHSPFLSAPEELAGILLRLG